MHPQFLFPRNGNPIPPARDTDGSVASVLAPFDAQLWPRHVQIFLGNAVWKATDVMISESRAEEKSWVYIAESQSQSGPGTPFEDDETACSDTEGTKPCTRWAQRWGRIESRL
jgi:hypothetical protein